MVKTEALSFRVDADLKAALTGAAEAEERSVSWLAGRILREWAVRHGHMRAAKPAPRSKPKDGQHPRRQAQ